MANIFPEAVYAFGAQGGASDNITIQSRAVTTRMEKKTATGADGEIIAVAFYGKIAEHKLELLDTAVIANLAAEAVGSIPDIVATAFSSETCYYVVEDVTVELTNDDFTKGNVTISEYVIED